MTSDHDLFVRAASRIYDYDDFEITPQQMIENGLHSVPEADRPRLAAYLDQLVTRKSDDELWALWPFDACFYFPHYDSMRGFLKEMARLCRTKVQLTLRARDSG